MKKVLVTMYVVFALAVFAIGVTNVIAEPIPAGEIITCAQAFPSTCTEGLCTQSDKTSAYNCTLIDCYNGTNNDGDVLYKTVPCGLPPVEEPIE